MNHFAVQAFVLLAFALGLFVLCWALWVAVSVAAERLEERKRNALRIGPRARSQFQSQTSAERKL
jgi:hypothetical protein